MSATIRKETIVPVALQRGERAAIAQKIRHALLR